VKIAIVHYSLPPIVGGVETVAGHHARLFQGAGHDVTAICGRGGEGLGTSLRHIPDKGSPEALRAALFPVLAKQEVVMMHNVCTMPFDLALTQVLAEAAQELPQVRFIAWIHDLAACNPDYAIPTDDGGPWDLLRMAQPHFEYVAVSPLRARQWALLTGTDMGRCRVVPNGIEPAEILRLGDDLMRWERAHRLLERDFLLLHPARLLRRKNVELGLEVAAAIKQAGRSCAYLITGAADPHHAPAAEYAAEIRQRRAQLGLKADAFFVQDHFPVRAEELGQLYSLADALFFPSRQEGFGLPMLEAALHRLPIFCSAIEALQAFGNQGCTRFSLDAPPAQIAAEVMRQLDASPAIQARKAALREHAWTAIFRKYLAPLLTPKENPAVP
jgi:mannosylglucosylglycerate synthase